MASYEPIDLSGLCNAVSERLSGRPPAVGEQMFHGLPFLIGDPADATAPCFIVVEPGTAVTVSARLPADHVIVAHRRLPGRPTGGPGSGSGGGPGGGAAVGSAVAEYTFRLAGTRPAAMTVPIRERLEIAAAPEEGWDASGPFLAASSARLRLADRYQGRWDDLGMRQCEAVFAELHDYFLWVWENPRPALQIVRNGQVVAAADEPDGARRIELEADIRVDAGCWLAARCGGPGYWDSPSHLGSWPRGIFAHTSPVYVACGGEWSQFDADHAQTMLALIDGGLQRIRRVAVRYPEDRISHQHGEADHSAYLGRPFLEALKRVRERLDRAQSGLGSDR